VQRIDIGVLRSSELFLDRLHLLAQKVLPLPLTQFPANLLLDLLSHLQHLQLVLENWQQQIQPETHGTLAQEGLPLAVIQIETGGDEITQWSRSTGQLLGMHTAFSRDLRLQV
jgi:hypothetical protein|tara:strand:+ start:1724 stop:2062 length:339 start_codon:yes stop_codon:yes gene_type:complete